MDGKELKKIMFFLPGRPGGGKGVTSPPFMAVWGGPWAVWDPPGLIFHRFCDPVRPNLASKMGFGRRFFLDPCSYCCVRPAVFPQSLKKLSEPSLGRNLERPSSNPSAVAGFAEGRWININI